MIVRKKRSHQVIINSVHKCEKPLLYKATGLLEFEVINGRALPGLWTEFRSIQR